MNFFLRQSPIILTDPLFAYYGGNTGTLSTIGQRQAAYTIAELAAEEDLGTFLLPTIVTGTYLYSHEILLDHAYVHQVFKADLKAFDGTVGCSITGTSNWYMNLEDAEYGLIHFGSLMWNCGCGGYLSPYQTDIVYQAGLPSGTTYTPNVLLALTTFADITLNEIIGYGNEAPGDAGISEYRNQEYSEKRMALLRTAFGNSPRANYAHHLLTKLRRYRYVGLGHLPVR